MPVPVDWDELLRAFKFVSLGQPYEHEAVLCRKTGKFLWHTESFDGADEWPDDADDDEKYLAIPHKKELDLGKPLVFAFAEEFLPDEFGEIRRMFREEGRLCAVQGSPATKEGPRSVVRFRGQGD